jgi:fatty-acyl-CoA synthase
VREYCRGEIAHYKIPAYVDFVEDYPMTASGKIQKYKLREAAVERHGLAPQATGSLSANPKG